MLQLQSLKVFLSQRLTEAVEEVIGSLERAISEYEEEMELRHHRLLQTAALTAAQTAAQPEDEQRRAVFPAEVQQLVIKQEVLCEQEELAHSLHPHIKEEEQDRWACQEVRVQEEPLQSSQLGDGAETAACGSADGGPGPVRILVSGCRSLSGSDEKTWHSSEAETGKPQTEENKVPVGDPGHNSGVKSFSCAKCGRSFKQKYHLQTHLRCHTGEKPYGCSVCGKRFAQKGNLTQHMFIHTREKPCSCPVCGERFSQKGNLTQHMTVHTREKPC